MSQAEWGPPTRRFADGAAEETNADEEDEEEEDDINGDDAATAQAVADEAVLVSDKKDVV